MHTAMTLERACALLRAPRQATADEALAASLWAADELERLTATLLLRQADIERRGNDARRALAAFLRGAANELEGQG